MTHYFKKVLDDKNVDNRLFDVGSDGHMGVIYRPYTDENQQVLDSIQAFLKLEKT